MIKKGTYVQISQIILKPEERASHVPEDTKKVPLQMWVKGFLEEEGSLGDNVEITTITGRKLRGQLVQVNPGYEHDFGRCVPELLHIGPQLRDILKEGGCRE